MDNNNLKQINKGYLSAAAILFGIAMVIIIVFDVLRFRICSNSSSPVMGVVSQPSCELYSPLLMISLVVLALFISGCLIWRSKIK